MKDKIIFATLLFLFTFVLRSAPALSTKTPWETIVFDLGEGCEKNWKEISHSIQPYNALIEAIPINQTIPNWTTLIGITFADGNKISPSLEQSVERSLENIKSYLVKTYPEEKMTWRVLEKSWDSAITEWILHEPHEDVPQQQILTRIFIRFGRVNTISITNRHGQMTGEERQKWIKLLKEKTSLLHFSAAEKLRGLSLVDRLKNSIGLGPKFADWEKKTSFSFGTGYTSSRYTPPSQESHQFTTYLEITSVPNVWETSLEDFFQTDQFILTNLGERKAKPIILERTPSEIVYIYTMPESDLYLNAVVRLVLTKRGYYTITYREYNSRELRMKELLDWRDQLKLVTPEAPSMKVAK